ncbi:MAG TPA: NUDIX domain-containing protein [Bryobacteraceae bacterium]|jgi:8-oxo-dGTP pyrophosphatase MutT (NUDIX family)|nr:NUDIX domain-containing protein [Bryobacteraceae bacterium]
MTHIDFDVVGLLSVRDGKILLCRKKHTTSLLILPGGGREVGESSIDCLTRELREELGEVAVTSPELVGVYTDRAAGPETTPPKIVRIELYRAELIGEPVASSEIGELVWFGEGDDCEQLAPSIRRKILPDLLARGILPWGLPVPQGD